MTYLYIDLETIPSQRPDVLEEIRAGKQAELTAALAAIKPPGTHKKPETIAAWMAEEAPKIKQSLLDAFESTVDAEYRKTSFDGAYGQICVIGWALDDEQAQTVYGSDEQTILKGFAHRLGNVNVFESSVVGHNVAAFDLRFLAQRHIVNGIKPHPAISRAASAKPWEVEKVFDTMVQWAGVGNRVKLDKLCKALGIKSPKGDIDGSKVWDYVQAGKLDEVAAYCAKDVEATREVFYRMTYRKAA